MIESKDFTYFLTVFESGEMGLEIGETRLYYNIDGGQLKVLSEFRAGEYYKRHYPDAMSVHTMNLRDSTATIKNILGDFIIEYITSSLVRNYPHFVGSALFTHDEYNNLYNISLELVRKQQEKAKLNTTELTELCSRYRLNPVPVDDDGNSWKANCPSGGHHWIMIAADSWGCGYCKKKGGVEELVNWLEQVKQKHI
ncbi:hypothetical protein JAO76_12465 [Pontibacter sp. BT310]|uniref:Zinc finger CHC2-type domain-containing protein n=1 Tax=Pontibacter populi TaxID=890055 RepID=A0ABS6XD00_9BACT|nr:MULTISPECIES: hypothetical protein [Pontibacter]MBJ6119012.1 hypothetical protein [Pontibacter sp. BT310]MBR0571440.1 hypothetical protein [Microvirga sp. STS03]MBW3365866.1 hypothetical protein [Pontibacter populi]